MRVAIVGAGAVGIATASFLHEAGADTCVVARTSAAEELRRKGLGRTGIFGHHRVPANELSVVESFAELAGAPTDAVVVCTKAHTATEVAASLAPHWRDWVGGGPPIVLFHNGWGSADAFAEVVDRSAVYNARVITGFRLANATTSDVTVHADAVAIGSLFGADPARLRPLVEAVDGAGLPTVLSSDIAADLWAKMLYNCALNPLGALRGVSYGELAAHPATRAIMDAVMVEIFRAMDAAGYATHWANAGDYRRDFYERILPPTAKHESSMLQDLRAGRRTEIDALSGAVVRLGAEHGVATPVNASLGELVRAIERS